MDMNYGGGMWEGGEWAGWSGGGKWDNCNSIINKYIKKKKNKDPLSQSTGFSKDVSQVFYTAFFTFKSLIYIKLISVYDVR